MEHEPVDGQDLLEPPDADVARHYLGYANAIVERRERVVDRRAGAWLTIVSAGTIAGYLAVVTASIRQGATSGVIQVLLVPILIWGQISAGIQQRSDRGGLSVVARRLITLGGVLVLVGALIMFFVMLADTSIPTYWMLLPIALVVLGYGGYGVVRLVRASHRPRVRPPARAALPLGVRGGTILIGLFLGGGSVLSAVPDDILRSVLLFLALLALLVFFLCSHLGIGLPRVGAAWRWPHLTTFSVSVGVLLALQIPALTGALVMPITALTAGVGMVVAFALVSGVPGRDLDA